MDDFPYSPTDVTLVHNNPSSVASLDELLCPLLTGTRIVIASPTDLASMASFAQLIEDQGVTRLAFCPVSLFQNLLLFLRSGERGRCKSLRFVNVGGEALPRTLVQNCLDYFGQQVQLINTWGMSETSNNATCETFDGTANLEDLIVDDQVSIGRPICNTNTYVLDHALRPVPQGRVGQLALSGLCITSGYLNKDGRSTFVPNHLCNQPGHETLMLTGDHACVLHDRLIFQGRQDCQLEVQGQSLYTGAIESAIQRHLPGVQRSVVMGLEGAEGKTQLVCFYQTVTWAEVTAQEVKETLQRHLPDHMIPSKIYRLDELPTKQPLAKLDLYKLKEIHFRRTKDEERKAKAIRDNVSGRRISS